VLLVDIGNTRTKYIQTDRLGIDSPTTILNSELSTQWCSDNWAYYLENDRDIYLVCVGQSPLVELLQQWCDGHNIQLNQITSEASKFGLTSFYQNYKQLGADRWLALLGAKTLYPDKNIIIADAGTATTVDCLQANGQHKGGWILPGIDIMFNSLLTDTANVKVEQQSQAQLAFGANSSVNVNNACWAATLGMIEQSIQQAKVIQCAPDLLIVIGGNGKQLDALMAAQKFQININYKIIHSEDIIFHGLKAYIPIPLSSIATQG
jgi:type III pantothenate kinase